MDTIVDTSIWSLALRRKYEGLSQAEKHYISIFQTLIEQGVVVLIGSIRQEILSGIKHNSQFVKLSSALRIFPDLQLKPEHYELAAQCFNQCRKKGIQGSNTDFLICAVGIYFKIPIFTSDHDFARFQKILPIQLL